MSALVLGIGNLLLMDEAVGVKVVEDLLDRYDIPDDVEVLDGGTAGIELLHYVQNRKHVFIADAAKTGNAPGTVIRLEGDAVPAFFCNKISPHQLGLSDLLAATRLTDSMPGHIVLFGIEPERLETGLEMSEVVQGKVSAIADMIAEELKLNGYKVGLKTKN